MSSWGDSMGYYSNLHISRQNEREIYDSSDWGNANEYLLEYLCTELEVCNEHRPKDWNDQYFDSGLAKIRELRERIEKIKTAAPKICVVAFSVPFMRTLPQKSKG